MKMKKVLAAALSLACASTLFAATAVTASAADKKEVVIWDYFETDAQKQMMQSLIDEFMHRHSHILCSPKITIHP